METTRRWRADLRIFLSSQKYKWLSNLAYRTQSIGWIAILALSAMTGIVSITVIYGVSNGIPGWSYLQMLALSGLASAASGISTYFIHPSNLVENMRNGILDQVLAKPYNPILIILSRFGWVAGLGSIVSGLAIFSYAIAQVQVSAVALAVAMAVFAIGCMAFVMFNVFLSILAYVLFKSGGFLNWIVNIASGTSSYPLTVFGLAGMLILTVGMPIGIASFYPAELVFMKADYLIGMGVALIGIALSYLFYRGSLWLLTFYTSGGG